jgi:hypothetical protein
MTARPGWLCLLLIATFCAEQTPAPETLPEVAVVRVDRSSLRINPLPTASDIEFLPAGNRVRLIKKSVVEEESWYLVRTGEGQEGWMTGQSLIIEGLSEGQTLKPIITPSEIGEKLVGQWFETSLTGATGYFKIYFYDDGTYRHGHGMGSTKPGRFQLLSPDNVILLEKGSGAGDFLKLRIIGRDIFLIGEEDGFEIAFRRRFDDPENREFKFE